MKPFKIILLVIGGLIALALIVAAFLPSRYVVTRYLQIKRPPEMVFEQVSKFSNWESWSPWRPMDKDAKYTFSGTDGSVGSKMAWDGDTVGKGYMEMKKIVPFTRVEMDLAFIEPWEMKSLDYFTLDEGHGNTLLSWIDEGELKYPLGRLYALFSNMDKMMGPDFEKGLKNIKRIVESTIAIFTVDRPETKIYYISSSSSMDPKEIQNAMTSAFGELSKFCTDNKIDMNSAPIAITTSYDNGNYVFDAAFPVKDNSKAPTGRIKAGIVPAGKYLKGIHVGPYSKMTETYTQINSYLSSRKLTCTGRSFEEYVSDPGNSKQEKLKTHIFFPIK